MLAAQFCVLKKIHNDFPTYLLSPCTRDTPKYNRNTLTCPKKQKQTTAISGSLAVLFEGNGSRRTLLPYSSTCDFTVCFFTTPETLLNCCHILTPSQHRQHHVFLKQTQKSPQSLGSSMNSIPPYLNTISKIFS